MKRFLAVALTLLSLVVWRSEALAACAGDCNGDGVVLINEVVTAVSIGLGSVPLGQCPPADVSGDGTVAINEVIAAVGYGLTSCPAAFAGDHFGVVSLDAGRTASLQLNATPDGRVSGVVEIEDPPAPLRTNGAGGGAASSRVDVSGSYDPATGAFSVRGSADGVEIEVQGVFPSAGQPGSFSLRIGSFTYTGSFGGPPTPTRTRTPTVPSGTVHRVRVGQTNLPFDPEYLEIEPGETVEWMWVGGSHSVVSSAAGGGFPNCTPDGRFDSGPMTSGTFSYTFTAPGTYEYHCGVADHCQSFETGIVVVRGPSTPTATCTPTIRPTPTETPTPETVGGVSTAMLGVFSGTVTNDFGGVFAARFQITVDVEVVHVTDLEGSVLGLNGQLTMTVASPTKLTFNNPDPFNMRSLALELVAPGHVTGNFTTGSMGMGTFGLAIDLTKEGV